MSIHPTLQRLKVALFIGLPTKKVKSKVRAEGLFLKEMFVTELRKMVKAFGIFKTRVIMDNLYSRRYLELLTPAEIMAKVALVKLDRLGRYSHTARARHYLREVAFREVILEQIQPLESLFRGGGNG